VIIPLNESRQLNSKFWGNSTNEAYEVGKQLESGILKISE
jgi:hypothetical protein